jgi:sugar O-acyltransferase (sialic acid O-acetyltransferase NeuD family)
LPLADAARMAKRLILFGAGGHAKVMAEAWLAANEGGEIAFLDDSANAATRTPLGHAVKGGRGWLEATWPEAPVALAIGNNKARDLLIDTLRASGRQLATIVHPAAVVSPSARLGEGCFLAAGSIVNAEAELAEGVIVNTGASVDHDGRIGRCAHIAPGARLCGNVRIGARSLIGVGSALIPGTEIGEDVVIGAGSVVIGPVPDGQTWVGSPARPIAQLRSTKALSEGDA